MATPEQRQRRTDSIVASVLAVFILLFVAAAFALGAEIGRESTREVAREEACRELVAQMRKACHPWFNDKRKWDVVTCSKPEFLK